MAREDSQVQGGEKSSPRRNTSASGVVLDTPPLTETHFTITGEQTIGEVIVVCVYWGNKYPEGYVRHLMNMVERNLSVPHRFICLSDRPISGVDCIPVFAQKWQGWWQKVSLFMPGLFPSAARILYLDLDVVITGDMTTLVQQWTPLPLTMIYNFGPNRHHAAHNSSVMMWTSGDPRLNSIHDLFTEDVMLKLHGDQCWIWRVLRENIADWPMEFVKSYKYDCRTGPLDPRTRIVVFHGDPKPHQCKEDWVVKNWR